MNLDSKLTWSHGTLHRYSPVVIKTVTLRPAGLEVNGGFAIGPGYNIGTCVFPICCVMPCDAVMYLPCPVRALSISAAAADPGEVRQMATSSAPPLKVIHSSFRNAKVNFLRCSSGRGVLIRREGRKVFHPK